LNFIGNQQSAVLRGERASTIPENFADWIDTAFALNRFEKDGADGAVEFRVEIPDIVEADEFSAGNHGCKRQAILFRGSDADGTESAAVE